MKWVKLPNGRFTRPSKRPTQAERLERRRDQRVAVAAALPRIGGRFATPAQVAQSRKPTRPEPTRWLDWKRQA